MSLFSTGRSLTRVGFLILLVTVFISVSLVTGYAEKKTITWGMRAFQQKEMETISNMFMKDNPDVNVELVLLPNSEVEYRQKMFTLMAGDYLPDVFELLSNYIEDFADKGLTVDLKPFMDKDSVVDVDYFHPLFLAVGWYEGGIYYLPKSADVMVIMYNKRMFKEAGLTYPVEEWTYEDFLADSIKLTETTEGGETIQWGYSAPYYFYAHIFMVADGVEPIAEDGKSVNLTSEGAINSLHRLLDPVIDGYYVPARIQQNMGSWYNVFTNAKAAMAYCVRIIVPMVKAQIEDDWDAVAVPTGLVKKSAPMGAVGLTMSSSSKDRDLAWEFIRYYFNPEKGFKYLIDTYAVTPPFSDLSTCDAWNNLTGPPTSEPFSKSMDWGNQDLLRIDSSVVSTFIGEMVNLEKAVVSGYATFEEAAKQAEERINRALAEAEE